MTARLFAGALVVAVLAALVVETARGNPRSLAAIRHEFGTGPVAGCMAGIAWRESRLDPRAANWSDRHSDGSRGSFGLFQIGALWRRPGESVAGFAGRMFNPAANAALAHRIYRLQGLAAWGGRCG